MDLTEGSGHSRQSKNCTLKECGIKVGDVEKVYFDFFYTPNLEQSFLP
jgi:hypothetical protein